MALSPITVAVHAATAGFRAADLVTAVAVAYAESGGWPDRPGGLWGLPGEPGGDPTGNATKARARHSAGGWAQWATHRSKKYLLFMPMAAAAAAAPAVTAITAGGVVDDLREAAKNLPGADVLDAARGALSLGVKAGAWLADRHNWVRMTQVGIGASLVVVGTVMLVRPDKTIGAVAGGIVKPIVKGAVGATKSAAKSAAKGPQ